MQVHSTLRTLAVYSHITLISNDYFWLWVNLPPYQHLLMCLSSNWTETGLVSPTCSSVGTARIVTLPFATWSLKWWYFTFRCLALGLILGSLAISVAPVLSSKTLRCTAKCNLDAFEWCHLSHWLGEGYVFSLCEWQLIISHNFGWPYKWAPSISDGVYVVPCMMTRTVLPAYSRARIYSRTSFKFQTDW